MASAASNNLLKISRNVIKKVYAVETAEGVGATVRRTIGTPNLRNLSPFLLLFQKVKARRVVEKNNCRDITLDWIPRSPTNK